MEKKKVINIADRLVEVEDKWAIRAMADLEASNNSDDIIRLILEIITKECEIGLGLLEVEGDDDLELAFFKQVFDVFQRAAGDCYFCRDLDPNEIKFEKSTPTCMTCRKKLANFLKAIGIDPRKVLV